MEKVQNSNSRIRHLINITALNSYSSKMKPKNLSVCSLTKNDAIRSIFCLKEGTAKMHRSLKNGTSPPGT